MPWRGVTVSEQRQRFLEDYRLKYYSVTELAELFGVCRTAAYAHPGHQGKWINRFEEHGQSGIHEHSRRPHSCPWQTDPAISLEKTKHHFDRLFETFGLPNRIRTDNGSPFASSALARQSQLSVWVIKPGIYPELPVLAD